jgi:hypothetical protein
MQTTHHRVAVLNKFRRYPRVRISTPFSCALSRLEAKSVGWFKKPQEAIGVVYDLSLRGVRVSTEAPMKPGDLVALTPLKLRLFVGLRIRFMGLYFESSLNRRGAD